MTTAITQAKLAYVLSLTEQDAKNAFENARRQAYLDQISIYDTPAYRCWADAVGIMRAILWQGSAGMGAEGAAYIIRDKSWKPPLSLDNVKFALYRSKARK